jgi:hypothetical protein
MCYQNAQVGFVLKKVGHIMDKWIEIEKFDFEGDSEEYSFTTRLAFENSWTIKFTLLAIVEYKKFMYLASITNDSVSPSAIVDIVWHQHLIFSESYNSFCELLGKKINHIPSTHKKEQKETFSLAKGHTTRLYQAVFGDQPKIIWEAEDVLKTIPLEVLVFFNSNESKLRVRVLLCVLFATATFIWSNQFVRQIQNPDFLYLFAGIIISALILNAISAYTFGHSIIKRIKQSWIIQNLHPYELIYTQHENIGYLILKIIDDLVKKKLVSIDERKVIILESKNGDYNKYEGLVLNLLEDKGNMSISSIVKHVGTKPLLDQTKRAISTIKNQVFESDLFNFYEVLILSLYSSILGFGFCRLYNGLINDRPISFLVITLVLSGVIVYKLNQRFIVKFLFRYPLCSSKKVELKKMEDDDIKFFLLSSAVLSSSTVLLMSDLNQESIFRGTFYSSGCSTSSCSSGDSSCGSGCGGCGGD